MVSQTEQAATAPDAANNAQAPSAPTVSVSAATNCRTGPDPNYPFVMLLQPGVTVPLAGKYSRANYWVITMPTGGTCWLWGAYATTLGDVSKLPEATPPQLALAPQPTTVPTKKNSGGGSSGSGNSGSSGTGNSGSGNTTQITINPGLLLIGPSAPSGLKATTNCSGGRTDLLSWHSDSNADGYNIYSNGKKINQITAADAGTGGFSTWQVSPGNIQTPITYGVSAYNSFGTSSTSSASAPGCP